MRRLSHVAGELIDRTTPVEFVFEGHRVQGYRGDTITSALAASGVRVLGRSFKYHRPRGILSAANHDANALVQVRSADRSIPNVRADVVGAHSDWQVNAVNTQGGLARDRLAVLGHLAPFLPVGFYYKAFYSKRWFPSWERMFRRLSGLGEVDLRAARRSTPKRYEFCDLLVIGGGPSGLSAALAAAERGAAVMLVDENPRVGGSGLYARGGSTATLEKTEALLGAVESNPRIRVLTSTYAAGYYADHWVALIAPECMVKVRARSVVIAQGAYEQPAVFRGNDLPGVMLASAAQRLLYHHAVATARRVAVLTANSEGYAAALDGLVNGVELIAVLDLRSEPGPISKPVADELVRRGVPVYYGVVPIEAIPGNGGEVGGLRFETSASVPSARQHIELDGIWMSVGFAPANALLHQANARMSYANAVEQFIPQTLPPGVYACGKVNGLYAFEERLADGREAGEQATGRLGFGAEHPRRPRAVPRECPTHPYPVFPHPRGREFVDFDEDLQLKDIENACQEGFDSSELLKRYSTVGMGPSQGKHSNMNALRILAKVRGESIESLGTTTARPMFHPVPLSHLAGRGFTPERRTPLDAEHEALGAVWMPAGNWRRPEYYLVAGKSRSEAIAAEVRAVRNTAGLIDVGTLGKIEIQGPRAAEFLERVYTARFANLKVGMTRYGLMLDEGGIIVDDGVIGRLGPESFYFTTTTGNSATVFREFGRLASWWGLPVGLVNLTGHYGAFNLAGPAARSILREHTALELSDEAFPYLGIREALVAGAPCRIMRVGFVGELGYEIHLPAEFAVDVWRALLASGARFRIQPFGVEAQRMLRLEKGHIIVGQDTDGVTNALEIEAPWALKMDKPFFVGQRSLRILEKQPRRQTLVGFNLPPQSPHRPKECQLVIDRGEIAGRLTSVGWSPTFSRWIGLALVTPAQAAAKQLRIRIDKGEEITADIVRLPLYDPKGERQRPGDSEEPATPKTDAPAFSVPGRRSPLDIWFRQHPEEPVRQGPGLRFEVPVKRERFGCKGPGAEAWLHENGYRVPPEPNSAVLDGGGVLVARLTTSEFLIEAIHGDSERVETARRQLGSAARPSDVYPVARQDLVIEISGAQTNSLLRQVCSVDFATLLETSESPSGPITLTSMIGVGAVVHIRRSPERGAVVTLWVDPSFAHYFWTNLLEVGRDLEGFVVVHGKRQKE
jgi:sarcosine oxidase subunit alpha